MHPSHRVQRKLTRGRVSLVDKTGMVRSILRGSCRGRLIASRTPSTVRNGIAQIVRTEDKADGRRRCMHAVYKACNPSTGYLLPSAHIAEAIESFTTGMGPERRESIVNCTRTSLSTNCTLCPVNRSVFYRHWPRSKAPVSDLNTADDDKRHCACQQ